MLPVSAKKIKESTKLKIILITLMLTVILISSASAQDQYSKEIFYKVFEFQSENLAELFTQNFLDQLPINNLQNLLNQYKNNLGKLKQIEENQGQFQYKLIFENGSLPAMIALNSNNKISGLRFGSMSLTKDSLDSIEDIISEFENLAGEVSVVVIKNNKEQIAALNPNKKLAVGSSFKLYLLKSLKDKLGSSDWDQIIKLNDENKSLPSGILHKWPTNTPLTLRTMANLMISISDNTATDHLIDYLGRKNLEKGLKLKNKPFLKTNEMFRIKHMVPAKTKEKYLKSDLNNKRRILEEIQKTSLVLKKVKNNPTNIENIEWFFSTARLSKIIYTLRDCESIYINSGLVEKSNWYRAGYKGGSEPGVLQFTHLLKKEKESDTYVVSITINNSEKSIDQNRITVLASRLISVIKNK